MFLISGRFCMAVMMVSAVPQTPNPISVASRDTSDVLPKKKKKYRGNEPYQLPSMQVSSPATLH
jgi:hypothetical protein